MNSPVQQVDLEVECAACNETGERNGRSCSFCFGSGFSTTEHGDRLLANVWSPAYLEALHEPDGTADAASVQQWIREQVEARIAHWSEWAEVVPEALTAWVYKVNGNEPSPSDGFTRSAWGDWNAFFSAGEDDLLASVQYWGGTWATRDPNSLRYIREEMAPGDVIIAYQTNRRAILGLARVVALRPSEDDAEDVHMVLVPTFGFEAPIHVHDLRDAHPWLNELPAFAQHSSMGMLQAISEDHAKRLIGLCLGMQPEIDDEA